MHELKVSLNPQPRLAGDISASGSVKTDGTVDPERRAPRILLTDTTRYAEATRLAMGFREAGCIVSAIHPRPGHPLEKAEVLSQSFSYHPWRPVEALAAAIDAAAPDLVIPCDDRGRRHLNQLHAAAPSLKNGGPIARLLERSLGPGEGYAVVASRFDLLRLARQEGLRTAETQVVRTTEDLEQFTAVHGFPVVLKADGTWGGVGVKIARTDQQARKALRLLSRPRATKRALRQFVVKRDAFALPAWWNGVATSITAQSYIEGRPANCAVVCWEGKVLAGIAVEAVCTQDETGPATIVRVIDSPEMMLAAERIAGRLRLSGFFGLDFMMDSSDAAYLIEMNARCTPLCHLRLGQGRDMIGALWAQVTGDSSRPAKSVTQNEMIAYFPLAWMIPNPLREESFQDIPENAPALVQELLHPWPERSLLSRAVQKGSDVAWSLAGKFARREWR